MVPCTKLLAGFEDIMEQKVTDLKAHLDREEVGLNDLIPVGVPYILQLDLH